MPTPFLTSGFPFASPANSPLSCIAELPLRVRGLLSWAQEHRCGRKPFCHNPVNTDAHYFAAASQMNVERTYFTLPLPLAACACSAIPEAFVSASLHSLGSGSPVSFSNAPMSICLHSSLTLASQNAINISSDCVCLSFGCIIALSMLLKNGNVK